MKVPNSKYLGVVGYKGNTQEEMCTHREKNKKALLQEYPSAKYLRFWEDSTALVGRIDAATELPSLPNIDGHKAWIEELH